MTWKYGINIDNTLLQSAITSTTISSYSDFLCMFNTDDELTTEELNAVKTILGLPIVGKQIEDES